MNEKLPRSNPYVGPRAFGINEGFFYGREREIRQLFQLLVARRIVLLHSPSGAGKTSLVQAGLIPKLLEDGFEVLPVARLHLDPPQAYQERKGFNRYIFSLMLSLEEGLAEDLKTPPEKLAALSLAEYLAKRSEGQDEDRLMVLILDQFEEVLTIDPTDTAQKFAFFSELGAVLRNPHLWALFAIREDYLGALEPYVRVIPTRLVHTSRLDLLGPESASQAIQKPAQEEGVDFTDQAAERLVDDLRKVRVQQEDGSFIEKPGPHVEPVQLQVVCYRLWSELPPGVNQIDLEQLEKVGDVDQSLEEYYAEQVLKIAQGSESGERDIRRWFENRLITPDGLRSQVSMGEAESGGLANTAIRGLVDAHLVRAEKRRGITWYELAHDRLVTPVRRNNQAWFDKHLSLLQRQADLWVQQGRPEGLILHGQALYEAVNWAEEHSEWMADYEVEFLQACINARQLEDAAIEAHRQELETAQLLAEAEKRRAKEHAEAAAKLRRQRVFLAVLIVIQIALGAQVTINWIRANQQKTAAQLAEGTAVNQRSTAEVAKIEAQYAEVTAQAAGSTAQAAAFTAEAQRVAAEAAGVEAQQQYNEAKAAEATALAEIAYAATVQAILEKQRAMATAAGTQVMVEVDLVATAQAQAALDSQRATATAENALNQYQVACSSGGAPPCSYTVVSGDSFSSITEHFYRERAHLPGLMDFNRDEGGYRKRLLPGDQLKIPAIEVVSRKDILETLYPECWKGEFPCWYRAEGNETYETIALRFTGDAAHADSIKAANWAWDPETGTLVSGPEITKGLAIAIPVPTKPSIAVTTCPGALESKIRVGVPAYVCTQRDRLIAKDEPASEGLEVFRMYPKTEISVVDGPVCGEDFNWWQIKVPGGTEVYFSGVGDERLDRDEIVWVREGSDNVDPYYICPLK